MLWISKFQVILESINNKINIGKQNIDNSWINSTKKTDYLFI